MVVLRVEGMHCDGCAKAVTRAILAVDPKAAVKVDVAGGRVEIETNLAGDRAAIAIHSAGYEARLA